MPNLVGYGSSDSDSDDEAAAPSTNSRKQVDPNMKTTEQPSAQQQLPFHEEKHAIQQGKTQQLHTRQSDNSESRSTVQQQEQQRIFADPERSEKSDEASRTPGTTIATTDGSIRTTAESMSHQNSSELEQQSPAAPSLHQLTMPPVPNLDIPPSPPGSPPAEIHTKVGHFLELKRRGVHFHTKLSASSALRNPALLGTLAERAGLLSEELYETTLPSELWDPTSFPKWAFKEQLAAAQRDRGKDKPVEFVKPSLEGGD